MPSRRMRGFTTKRDTRLRDLSVLEQRIGHVFADRRLLEHALTHVSTTSRREDSFQRLEFLGDRVLGLAVADLVFRAFPLATEGELSRRLARLVRRETCAEVAAGWDVGPFIRLGRSEAQAMGATRAAILSDVCESIVAAIYLDGGFASARTMVERFFGPYMDAVGGPLRDAKSLLQEWAQARSLGMPIYEEKTRTGPDHAPSFTIAVRVSDKDPVEGLGPSKRLAEQAAAEAFLLRQGLSLSEVEDA